MIPIDAVYDGEPDVCIATSTSWLSAIFAALCFFDGRATPGLD